MGKTHRLRGKNPLMKNENTKLYIVLAFVLPFVIMFGYFAIRNYHGFGFFIPQKIKDILSQFGITRSTGDESQHLVIDMWHQYFPFFKTFGETVKNGDSLLYCWSGLGENFISVIAYYCSSPLYFLAALFPAEELTAVMGYIIIIKISCASGFMAIYLKNVFKRNDILLTAFGLMYGFCAFCMGYSWCVMWLGVVALLPLCMLGLNKLIDENKFVLYTVSLALIMLANYYIGVMVCIFIALYYFVLYFSRTEARGAKHFWATTGKAVGFSAIGVGIASVMLIPTYLSMQMNYYMGSSSLGYSEKYRSFIETLGNLMPFNELTVRDGLPNIYCGVITVVLAVVFFLNGKIAAREKVLNGCILGFLLLSFNWSVLDFVWHGLHYPNELPHRFSFIFSFVLLTIAFKSLVNLRQTTRKQIAVAGFGIFAFVLILEKTATKTFEYWVIYVAIALLIVYVLFVEVYRMGKLRDSACKAILFVLILAEVGSTGFYGMMKVGNSSYDVYYETYDDMEALIDSVKKEDTGFYRMETSDSWTVNDPALYGYKGVSLFSSVINSNLAEYLSCLGVNALKGWNSYTYNLSSPVFNSAFNVNYILGNGHDMLRDFALTKVTESGDCVLYKNNYPLSLGFAVNESIYNFEVEERNNRFEAQENFVSLATGGDVSLFTELPTPEVSAINATATVSDSGNITVSNLVNDEIETKISLDFDITEDTELYGYVGGCAFESYTVYIDNDDPFTYPSAARNAVVSLGHVTAGQHVCIDICLKEGKSGNLGVKFASFDRTAWESAYAVLSKNQLDITDYSNTNITGNITVDKDCVLYTSIPYDKGWSVTVDGKAAEITPIANALCAVNLTAGEHTVEFNFFPEGLGIGMAVSGFCIVLLIALAVINKKMQYGLFVPRKTEEQSSGGLSVDMLKEPLPKGYEEFDLVTPDDGEYENAPDLSETQEVELPGEYADTESVPDTPDDSEQAPGNTSVETSSEGFFSDAEERFFADLVGDDVSTDEFDEESEEDK